MTVVRVVDIEAVKNTNVIVNAGLGYNNKYLYTAAYNLSNEETAYAIATLNPVTGYIEQVIIAD